MKWFLSWLKCNNTVSKSGGINTLWRKFAPLLPRWKWRWSCQTPIRSDTQLLAGRRCWSCWLRAETEALQTSRRIWGFHLLAWARWPSASAPKLNSWRVLRHPVCWYHSSEEANQRWSCSAGNDTAELYEGRTAGWWCWFGKVQNRWFPPGYSQTSWSLCSGILREQICFREG